MSEPLWIEVNEIDLTDDYLLIEPNRYHRPATPAEIVEAAMQYPEEVLGEFIRRTTTNGKDKWLTLLGDLTPDDLKPREGGEGE
jgi:hypothetical protein